MMIIRRTVLCSLSLLLLASPFAFAEDLAFEYNVCNGLSNQLLIHASAIAKAVQRRYSVIYIPDYFIVNGEQTSDEPVLPNHENSVPLAMAFDIAGLQHGLWKLGIRMQLVQWKEYEDRPECPGLSWMPHVNPDLVLDVLKLFQPSDKMKHMTELVQNQLQDKANGVCYHHRDGKDWHDHCQRWSAQQAVDGAYRGNCEALPHSNLLQLLENRALTSSDRFLYYCGDHDIPQELQSQNQYAVYHKDKLLSEEDKSTIQTMKPGAPVRDLWALVDFFVCGSLHYLAGNSVSTFTALQIALREQEGAYWYNSQSIPLGSVWPIYQIPIVYTYTELSDVKGKFLLQVSIASLRRHMPHNKVYILYHGDEDIEFRQWLRDQRVTIFDHNPSWKEKIEQMRQNGNSTTSNLFLHSGNYFGTWQRIDVPKFIETEYVLLLDSDTVIIQPFRLSNFGLDLTHSIAMSAEQHRHHVGHLLNAGVTLLNVPRMRESYDDFLRFILDHVEAGRTTFNHPAPSDQGAYLEFYKDSVQQLSPVWNWKSYWGVNVENKMFAKIKILHFHGMKPHDYVRTLLGQPCDSAISHLCDKYRQPIFRVTVGRFLQAAASIPDFHENYCASTFDLPQLQRECVSTLDTLATGEIGQFRELVAKADVYRRHMPGITNG